MNGISQSTIESQKKKAEQLQQEEEAKKTLLHTIMDTEARARLGRIALVDPSKSKAIEDRIIMLAQKGQISEIKESDIISILESMESHTQHTKVTIQRHATSDDEMDDDFFDV